jgi:hypothetical protein
MNTSQASMIKLGLSVVFGLIASGAFMAAVFLIAAGAIGWHIGNASHNPNDINGITGFIGAVALALGGIALAIAALFGWLCARFARKWRQLSNR